MKMNFIKIAVMAVILPVLSCSKDDGYAGITTTDPVTEEPTEDVLTPENVRSYMADPNATDETVALFYNLKKLQKTKYLIGQQDAFAGFYNNTGGESDIKKATGHDPALLGSDFMFITDDQNTGEPSNWFYQQEQQITAHAIEAYDKGMVNIFAWHIREPYEGEHFYTSEMTDFQKQNAFASILPGGENHDYYKSKLDKVADVLNNLKGSDNKLIPVIFRPWHEFDGSWFWWGADYCTPQQYKEAWQFTVEYLRDTKNVHNVLYAFSPDNSYSTDTQYLSRYPGDEYIDLLGMDNYGDFANGSANGVTTANNKLKMVSDLAKEKVKIAAMTETGYRVTSSTSPLDGFFANNIYKAMTDNNVELAFVMFWSNNQEGYYVPPAGQSDTQDFVDFANKAESVLVNTIPDMYIISE
ncbi:beta-mannosidase [Flavobacterium salilacus subsp. salilacus]|uniref:glycoside hydrolase family 26 protein n=1 Tax=Flavobacterium TaxID=237 RepID=UPI001074B25C|nr:MULTISPECIES: glycosyl hydrolase [Flavobacterium]KAF2519575.1 beta-mannosidase [Flavobacterium salilacus subsp. salilacus]MBE1614523.1 beta-mannosidase [Flavobacterium sp. SaA2.13]